MKERLITPEKYNWTLDGRALDELSGIYRENLRAKESERVNRYFLEFDTEGKPKFAFENETILGSAEYRGMQNLRQLAEDGFKYLFWFSPPGGRSEYTESRLVVGIVRESQGEINIECRGIPLKFSGERLLEVAEGLMDRGGVSMDPVYGVEDLREQAVGINLRTEKELWDLCEELMGGDAAEIWEVIRSGKDILYKEETKAEVALAWEEMEKKLRGQVYYDDKSFEGARLLELVMRGRGYELVEGNHGGSALGAFGSLYGQSEIAVRAEYKGGGWVCPCGKRLLEGQMICPKCGLKFRWDRKN